MSTRQEIELLYYSLLKKEKLVCERSYYKFFKAAWKVLEPQTKFIDNWHFKYLADILQGEVERIAQNKPKTRDYIINISPRSGKSYLVSVMLVPWAWIRYPHLKFIVSSHSERLATDLSVETRKLIESDWYKANWGANYKLSGDQNVKTYYGNDKGGRRMSTTTSKAIAGFGADIIISDDSLDPQKANSDAERLSAVNHIEAGLDQRLNNNTVGLILMIMQRSHEDDIAGHFLRKAPNQYHHISIPAELNGGLLNPPSLKTYYKDGYFFPERFGPKFLHDLKVRKPYIHAGQFLQRPAPAEGAIIKREWWGYYDQKPKSFDLVWQSWDMAVKGNANSDFVACTIWGRKDKKRYILGLIHKQMGFKDTKREVIRTKILFPESLKIVIEDKANGPPIIESLREDITGIEPFQPRGSKESRAEAISDEIASGNVLLPNPNVFPQYAEWVETIINECANFPNGMNDDIVDSISMAILWDKEAGGGTTYLEQLMAQI